MSLKVSGPQKKTGCHSICWSSQLLFQRRLECHSRLQSSGWTFSCIEGGNILYQEGPWFFCWLRSNYSSYYCAIIFSYTQPCTSVSANFSLGLFFVEVAFFNIVKYLWINQPGSPTKTLAMTFMIFSLLPHVMVLSWAGYRLTGHIKRTLTRHSHRFNLLNCRTNGYQEVKLTATTFTRLYIPLKLSGYTLIGQKYLIGFVYYVCFLLSCISWV